MSMKGFDTLNSVNFICLFKMIRFLNIKNKSYKYLNYRYDINLKSFWRLSDITSGGGRERLGGSYDSYKINI